jgi:acyl carrier protein
MAEAKYHINQQQIEHSIKEHILKEFSSAQFEGDLENDFPLVEQGIIDSMGIFRLVNFLEDKFGFTFDPQELLLENFETINAIKAFVIGKIKESGQVVED